MIYKSISCLINKILKKFNFCDTMNTVKAEVEFMAISYRPLWIQLADKGLHKTDVIRKANLTTNVMASMEKKTNNFF